MKTSSLQLGNLLALVLLAALACGCASPALWQSTSRREWKPITPDQVVLFTSTNQQRAVVVFFRQLSTVGTTNTSRNVGWRLGQSPEELALTTRAIGQFTNSCGELRSVPLFQTGNVPTDASSQSPGFAVWNSTDQRFTVYLDGYPCVPYLLPTNAYRETHGDAHPRDAFCRRCGRGRSASGPLPCGLGQGLKRLRDPELNRKVSITQFLYATCRPSL